MDVYGGIVKRIQSFFLQTTILLLLVFTSVANVPYSLFTIATTGSDEVISTESSLNDIDDLASHNDLEGCDGGSSTDNCIFSPPSFACYPLYRITGQTNSRPLRQPIPFHILYQSLIFYHPVM